MIIQKQTQDLEILLDYLKQARGFDFNGYKRSSLIRRIQKRLMFTERDSYSSYIDYLEVHPEEFTQLFNTILINVTGFFRDPKAWEFIAENILPRIISDKKEGETIRIWSAGCSSGEEAYTIAMLLAEHLGIEGFKEQVKVYATDLDEEALTSARVASYEHSDLNDVPEELAAKYFERIGNRYFFQKDLRRSVIFGRHDLVQDAPISRIHLLICRNILMYFNAETQGKILTRLNFALNERGFLFLGKAEMLLSHLNLYLPVDLKHRVFTKTSSGSLRDRLLGMAQNGEEEVNGDLFGHIRVRDAAFYASPIALLVVDPDGQLSLANEKGRALFGLSNRDLGRPFQDLEVSYRPVELRSSIELCYEQKSKVILHDVEINRKAGSSTFVDIELTPLIGNKKTPMGISISFSDVTDHKRLQNQLEQANQELETAMEELQSTNEELETTNEELQSTIEELETTNEELETMNEELQSTNEELETINDELSQRTKDLNHINGFFESILTSLRGGIIILNNEQNVEIWNRKSEDLWGLREEEVAGHNFFSLDIGLPVDQLRKPIRALLSGESAEFQTQVEATNRRGRSITCNINFTPLFKGNHTVSGVILVIEQNDRLAEAG